MVMVFSSMGVFARNGIPKYPFYLAGKYVGRNLWLFSLSLPSALCPLMLRLQQPRRLSLIMIFVS